MATSKYIDNKATRVYKTWTGMTKRCSKKYQEKRPSYIGCSIDERWYDFQVFTKWFEENYVEGWELDKDILFKGNKIYSPETCCFVPQEINNLFTKRQNDRGELPIGVRKMLNKFQARINKNGLSVYLGTFYNPIVAFLAYKEAKEEHIKELADKHSLELSEKVYEALYAYKVEIND